MRTFTMEIFLETKYVTYYSVIFDGSQGFETDKFIEKHKDNPKYAEAVDELVSLLAITMGEKHGALRGFFRDENSALALPGKPGFLGVLLFDFPLRLFCYRISDSLVVLMNGGVKSAQTAQGSPGLSMKFVEANQIARRLDEAFADGDLIVGGKSKRRILPQPPADEWYI